MKTLTYLRGTTKETTLFRQVYENEQWQVNIRYFKSNQEYQEDIQNGTLDHFLCDIHFEPKISSRIKVTFVPPSKIPHVFMLEMPKFIVTGGEAQKLQKQLEGLDDVIADAEEAFRKHFPGILHD